VVIGTVESDVAPLNIGLATAYHRAQNRPAWRSLVETATSIHNQYDDGDDADDRIAQQPILWHLCTVIKTCKYSLWFMYWGQSLLYVIALSLSDGGVCEAAGVGV